MKTAIIALTISICAIATSERVDAQVQVPSCKENSIWTVDLSGNILQWQLISNQMVFVDTIMVSSPVSSLAFCNSLNPSTIQRTFYGANAYTGTDVYYFDGSAWQTLTFPGFPSMSNAGGYRDYLFYSAVGTGASYLNEIYRYDGNAMTLLRHLTGRYFSFADLSIDETGTIWCLTGPYPLTADSVVAYDTAGNQLTSYPLNLDVTHGYGSFLMNGKLYLAFGSGNPVYPSSLVGISFNTGQAVISNVIPFPNSDFVDIAGCNPGFMTITGIEEQGIADRIKIGPNPFTSELHIELPQEFANSELFIVDALGKIVYMNNGFNGSTLLLNDIPAGFYSLIVSKEDIIVRKQIIRQ